MLGRCARWIGLAGLLACLVPVSVASDRIVGLADVIDGDTIKILDTQVRLHGIDAPESDQICLDASGRPWACGQNAARALSDRVGRSMLSCRRTDTDRYSRMVAVRSLGWEDVNAWMVGSGWAVAFRRYSMDYVPHEQRAKARRAGIWAGSFVMRWDRRRGGRMVQR